MPAEGELDAYYHCGYRLELGKGRRPARGRLWRIAQVAVERSLDLLARIPEEATTLDAGCGAGELVYMLGSAGCRSFGFDPDSSYIEWARSTAGINVIREGFQNAKVDPVSFDLITLYHVLEHLPDPSSALDRCARWLRHDGLLVIEVPNFESTVQGPGHAYQKGHLYYWNLPSLRALGLRTGFRLEEGGVFNEGENLRCYFRRSEAAPPPSPEIPGNAEWVTGILQAHTRITHYASATPYRRVWHRLRRTTLETILSFAETDLAILEFHARALQRRLVASVPRPVEKSAVTRT